MPYNALLYLNTKEDNISASHTADGTETHAQSVLNIIETSLDDDKAEDIISIDLQGKCSFADNMVIASGRSQRHVGSVADHLVEKLKQAGHPPLAVEGMQNCDWVLVDSGDVIVHIFRPEMREFYNLEKMWDIPVIAAQQEHEATT